MLDEVMDIPIERHIKVEGKASPDDPALNGYWAKRQTRYGKTYWGKVQSSVMWPRTRLAVSGLSATPV